MNKSIQFLLAIATIPFFSACSKLPNSEIVGCDPVELIAAFRVADKLSGEDLFFSNNPKYQLEDIKIYNVKDKAHKNPIPLTVFGNDDQRVFLLPLEYSNPIDTMIIKIANTTDDLFMYKTKKEPCAVELKELSFNSAEIVPEKGILIFKK